MNAIQAEVMNYVKKIRMIYSPIEWDNPYRMRDLILENLHVKVSVDDVIWCYHFWDREYFKTARKLEQSNVFINKTKEECFEILNEEFRFTYGVTLLKFQRFGGYGAYRECTFHELLEILEKSAISGLKSEETRLRKMQVLKMSFQRTGVSADEVLGLMRNIQVKMIGEPIEAEQ